MGMSPEVRAGIFAGESGGNYDAIFGYANQDPNSQFYGVRPSKMTVGEVLDFTDPRGPYAQSVKSKIGRIATPVGGYQGVGTTIRSWVKENGIPLDTPFNQATQDQFGDWVYDTQGTGAWEGYRGPKDPGSMKMSFLPEGHSGGGRRSGGSRSMANSSQWDAIINEAMDRNKQGGGWKGALSEALMTFAQNAPRMARGQSMDFSGGSERQSRKVMNKTLEWLSNMGRKDLAAAVAAGALDPASAVKLAYEKGDAVNGVEVDGKLVNPQTGEIIYQSDGPEKMDPQQVTMINSLRDDLRGEMTNINLVQDGAQTIATMYQNPGAVSDYALAVGFAKIVDPGSVAREGEVAAVANSGSMFGGFAEYLKNAISGTGRMPPEVRTEIAQLAARMANEKIAQGQAKLGKARETAGRYGIPFEDIYWGGELTPVNIPAGGTGAKNGPPQMTPPQAAPGPAGPVPALPQPWQPAGAQPATPQMPPFDKMKPGDVVTLPGGVTVEAN